MENLNFGQAIEALKNGQLVARKGWNGKGMFLFIRPLQEIKVRDLHIIKTLPKAVVDYYNTMDELQEPSEQGLTKIQFTPYICMVAADKSIVNGWLASQTDMLANDWTIL